MNDDNLYYLMHQDEIVTILTIDEVTGSVIRIGQKVEKDLLPPGGNCSPEDLKKWWERRAVPLKQGNIERILSKNKIPTTQSFLVNNLGLSLSDHYWVKPIDSSLTWSGVNFFSNDFKDEIGELQFSGNDISDNIVNLRNKTTFYPSASLQGELQKKWVIKDGERYLVKGNYGQSYQQSINEVIATLLHQKQGKMAYTKYQLCDIEIANKKAIGCVCKNFATEHIEFISAYDLSSSIKKDNSMSEYEHFIYVCTLHGLTEEYVREYIEYQVLSDFVITNVDRHFNNFGVLRNPANLKLIGMAPIFDSGNSMFWNMPQFPKENDLLDIQVNSFKSREVDMLKYINDISLVNIDKLPEEKEIRELLKNDTDYEKKIEGIILGYQKKINLLERLQSGKEIYKYGYKMY